jgi:hypothetical protein
MARRGRSPAASFLNAHRQRAEEREGGSRTANIQKSRPAVKAQKSAPETVDISPPLLYAVRRKGGGEVVFRTGGGSHHAPDPPLQWLRPPARSGNAIRHRRVVAGQ